MSHTFVRYWLVFALVVLCVPLAWAGAAVTTAASLGWSSQQIEKANTAANTDFLTDEEKDVIFLTNLVRFDGALFMRTFLQAHTPNDPSNYYISSLYNTLPSVRNLSMLTPHQCLSATAAYHANDMGRTGGIGHDSSDGTPCFDRVRRCGSRFHLGENCSYGYNSAVDIVMQLLIDQDVPSLGHRENILGPVFNTLGVAIRPHAVHKYNCVMDFSSEKIVTRTTVAPSYSTTTTTTTRTSYASTPTRTSSNYATTPTNNSTTVKHWPQRFYDHSGRHFLSVVSAGYTYDFFNNRHSVDLSLLDFRVTLLGVSLLCAEMCVLPYRTSVAYKPSLALYLPVGKCFAFVPYLSANVDATGLWQYIDRSFDYTFDTDFYAGATAGLGFELSGIRALPMRVQVEYRYPLTKAHWQTDLQPSVNVGVKFYLGKAFR